MGREWLACLRPSADRFGTCQSHQAVGVVAIHLRALPRQPLCDLPPSEARVLLGFVTNLSAEVSLVAIVAPGKYYVALSSDRLPV